MTLRIGLLGAVLSTQTALEALAAAGYAPAVVMSLPLDKRSRHSDFIDLEPVAERLKVPVMRVDDVNSEDVIAKLRELNLDLLLVIGWSRICGRAFRASARLGAIGYHPTLLPKLRGRAALAWTIILQVRRTGGTLFWLADGVDEGDIAVQEAFDLDPAADLPQLIGLHMEALGRMLPPLVRRLARGERPASPQRHQDATYLAIRRPADGEIDWSQGAAEIERLVRATTRPYPGAFTYWRGRRVTIWSAQVVSHPQWTALPGQVFKYVDGVPIVRCGDATDLALTHYEVAPETSPGIEAETRISGQPRLGRKS